MVDNSKSQDNILRLYEQYTSGNNEVKGKLKSKLEGVVKNLSSGLPINSPAYARIAYELGLDEVREFLDEQHRGIAEKAIKRRLSQRGKKNKQPEEHLRQYVLERLDQGILGEVLANPITEVDTPYRQD